MEKAQTLEELFPISDELWLNLRTKCQTTTDLDFIEWAYDQMGELEMQLAYTLHLIEQRSADLRA
jgi:plasmid maintenance system antidote protein VapI